MFQRKKPPQTYWGSSFYEVYGGGASYSFPWGERPNGKGLEEGFTRGGRKRDMASQRGRPLLDKGSEEGGGKRPHRISGVGGAKKKEFSK